MSLSQGSRHGPYDVVAAIGFGGIAQAYVAHDTERDLDVVIQPLTGPQASAPDRMSDVRRAVDELGSLIHPNLGRLLDVDTALLPAVLVSERPAGDTIADILDSDLGPRFGFEPPRALAIAEEVCAALVVVHAHGFLHGNLRAASVTLAPDGHASVHGLACLAIDAPAGSMHAAELDRDCVAYMSPEQVRGEAAGPASDLWALGVLLYEMLSGVRPFLGEDVDDIRAAIVDSAVEWSALPIDTPRAARELLRACLQKTPARRPADAATVLRELEPYGAPRPVSRARERAALEQERESEAGDGDQSEEKRQDAVPDGEPAVEVTPAAEVEPAVEPDLAIATHDLAADRGLSDTNAARDADDEGHLWVELGVSDSADAPATVADPIPVERRIAEEVLAEGVTLEAEPPGIATADVEPEPSVPRRRRLGLAAVAALVIGAIAGGAALWRSPGFLGQILPSRQAATVTPSTYVLSAPPSRPIAVADVTHHDLAISPDGTVVAYAAVVDGRRQLYRRRVDELDGVVLPGLPSPQTIFFSWDGRSIGFADGESAWHAVALDGSGLRRLADQRAPARGATWGRAGSIILAEEGSGLTRIALPRGTRTSLTTPDRSRGETGHYWPKLLPDGRAVLFSIASETERPAIAVLDLATGAIHRLVPNGQNAQFVEPDFIVYSAGGSLYGVGFDRARLELRGYPVPLVRDVVSKPSGAADFDVSRSGSLVYVPGRLPGFASRTLAWVRRDGVEEPLPADPRGYSRARLEPDGRRIALEVREPEPERLVWDLEGRRLQPALAEEMDQGDLVARPVATGGDGDVPASVATMGAAAGAAGGASAPAGTVSPDGRWIAFASAERGRADVFVRGVSAPVEDAMRVTSNGGRYPLWSPAGDELFYVDPEGAMMAVDVETDPTFSAGEPHELFRGPYVFDLPERPFDISPDGERFLVIKPPESTSSPAFDIVIVEDWAEQLRRLPSLR